jgi:hypothetical protein
LKCKVCGKESDELFELKIYKITKKYREKESFWSKFDMYASHDENEYETNELYIRHYCLSCIPEEIKYLIVTEKL